MVLDERFATPQQNSLNNHQQPQFEQHGIDPE